MRSLSQVCVTEMPTRKPSIRFRQSPTRLKSEQPTTEVPLTRFSTGFFNTEYDIGMTLKKSNSLGSKIILSKGKCIVNSGKIQYQSFQLPKLELKRPQSIDFKKEILNWIVKPKETTSPTKKKIVFKAIKRDMSQKNKIVV